MEKKILIDDQITSFEVLEKKANFIRLKLEGEEFYFEKMSQTNGEMKLKSSSKNIPVLFDGRYYLVDGVGFLIENFSNQRIKKRIIGQGHMNSPMPGKILKILMKEGDQVVAGQALLIMEAMKMEHTIKASVPGKILKIHYKEGDQVAGGVELVHVQ